MGFRSTSKLREVMDQVFEMSTVEEMGSRLRDAELCVPSHATRSGSEADR